VVKCSSNAPLKNRISSSPLSTRRTEIFGKTLQKLVSDRSRSLGPRGRQVMIGHSPFSEGSVFDSVPADYCPDCHRLISRSLKSNDVILGSYHQIDHNDFLPHPSKFIVQMNLLLYAAV
jgi:hypothetical protein